MSRPNKYGERSQQISLHVPTTLIEQLHELGAAVEEASGWKVSRNELIVAALAAALTNSESFFDTLFLSSEISPASFGDEKFKEVIVKIIAPLRLEDTVEARTLTRAQWRSEVHRVLKRLSGG